MKRIINLLTEAVAYTYLEMEQQPDGLFEKRVINKELGGYTNAIVSNCSAWECILFEARATEIREYTDAVYPLLLDAIARVHFILSLNEITRQFDQDSISTLYDASYHFCLEILRYMAPDAVSQFHEALIHPHK